MAEREAAQKFAEVIDSWYNRTEVYIASVTQYTMMWVIKSSSVYASKMLLPTSDHSWNFSRCCGHTTMRNTGVNKHTLHVQQAAQRSAALLPTTRRTQAQRLTGEANNAVPTVLGRVDCS